MKIGQTKQINRPKSEILHKHTAKIVRLDPLIVTVLTGVARGQVIALDEGELVNTKADETERFYKTFGINLNKVRK